MAELIDAHQQKSTLQSELEHPTASRAYAAQLKLSNAVKTA